MLIYATIFAQHLAERRTSLNYEVRLEEEQCRLQQTQTLAGAERTAL